MIRHMLWINSGIRETFSCGIWNPGLWNPDFSSRNLESRQRLESGLQGILNLVTGIQNTKSVLEYRM